jgi:hypothetical protein
MVGHLTLDQAIGVRIPVPQPLYCSGAGYNPYILWSTGENRSDAVTSDCCTIVVTDNESAQVYA